MTEITDTDDPDMPLRPLTRLGKPLRILLNLNIWLSVLAAAIGIYEYDSRANPSVDEAVGELVSEAYGFVISVDSVKLSLAVILGATFLAWIYRVSETLHALSSEPMNFSPRGSVGWYFVPVINLFKPYQAMAEIWDVSHRGASTSDSILRLWWLLWIASTIGMRIVQRGGYLGAVADITANGIDVVLSVVALILVTRISRAYASNFVEPV